jgi:hypothetical protein
MMPRNRAANKASHALRPMSPPENATGSYNTIFPTMGNAAKVTEFAGYSFTAACARRAAGAYRRCRRPRRRTALCPQIIAELLERPHPRRRDQTRIAHGPSAPSGLVVSYWKVIISVRLSVGDFGFKGSFFRLPSP